MDYELYDWSLTYPELRENNNEYEQLNNYDVYETPIIELWMIEKEIKELNKLIME